MPKKYPLLEQLYRPLSVPFSIRCCALHRCGHVRSTEALIALNFTERRLFFSAISGFSGSVVQNFPFLSQFVIVLSIRCGPTRITEALITLNFTER